MNKIILSILAVVIYFPSITFACSCSIYFNFCESTSPSSTIVSAEIIKKYEGTDYISFMDIRVEDEILGVAKEEFYTIVSYNTSCDVFLNYFEIGSSIITEVDHFNLEEEGANFSNFYIGVCASDYLTQDEFRVYGNIQEGITSMDYQLFKESIGQCAEQSILDRDEDEYVIDNTKIFPNPTTSTIQIRNFFLEEFAVDAMLINASGMLIAEYKNIFNSNTEIDLSNLAQGIYFIQLRYKEKVFTKKIVKI